MRLCPRCVYSVFMTDPSPQADSGKYAGAGRVIGNSLAVATFADGKSVIMVMTANPDGSLTGRWWRQGDKGSKGTETWKKK